MKGSKFNADNADCPEYNGEYDDCDLRTINDNGPWLDSDILDMSKTGIITLYKQNKLKYKLPRLCVVFTKLQHYHSGIIRNSNNFKLCRRSQLINELANKDLNHYVAIVEIPNDANIFREDIFYYSNAIKILFTIDMVSLPEWDNIIFLKKRLQNQMFIPSKYLTPQLSLELALATDIPYGIGEISHIKYNKLNYPYNFYIQLVCRKGALLGSVPDEFRDILMCETAVLNDPFAIQYVPKHRITAEMAYRAFRRDPACITHIPDELLTENIWMEFIIRGGSLCRVPFELRTLPILIEAVRINRNYYFLVPDEHKGAIRQALPHLFQIIPDDEIYKKITIIDPDEI